MGVVAEELGWRTGFASFGEVVSYVAKRYDANGHWQDEHARQDDADTVRRPGKSGRPIGRALQQRAGYKPDEDLAESYDPDFTIAQSFLRPTKEVIARGYARVKAGGEWVDPGALHRMQVIAGPGMKNAGQLVEHKVSGGKGLYKLAQTSEYRRSRFYEMTGDWPTRLTEADYQAVVLRPLREGLDCWHEQNKERLAEAEKDETLRPAVQRAKRTLRESCFDFAPPDQGGPTNPMQNIDQEYVPLGGAGFFRQLYLQDHWKMIAKCFYERHHNELAKTAIQVTSDFVLGRGIGWKIKDERCSDVWDEFWERNDMERYLRVLVEDLSWQGELLIWKKEILRGFVSIQSMDPSGFYDIVTDPKDPRKIFYFLANGSTPYQQVAGQMRGVPLNVPTIAYVIDQIPGPEMTHVKVNVSASEKWGRSDFYNSLGTLKRHRDWVNATTLKDMLQANLVWKIILKGDDADVNSFINNSDNATLPAFGGTWVENEALTLEQMHADVAQGGGRLGAGSTGSFLTALFASAQQMPVTYFNQQGSGPARAVALTQAEPFAKKIATRQQVVRGLLDQLYEFVMRKAVEAGRVDRWRVGIESADPEWIFPSLYEEDRNAKLEALTLSFDQKCISHRTLATQEAQELGLGEYDYEAEMEAIKLEQAMNWPPQPAPTMVDENGMPVPGMPGQAGMETTGAVPGLRPRGAQPPGLSQGRTEKFNGADARADFKKEFRGKSIAGLKTSQPTSPPTAKGQRDGGER